MISSCYIAVLFSFSFTFVCISGMYVVGIIMPPTITTTRVTAEQAFNNPEHRRKDGIELSPSTGMRGPEQNTVKVHIRWPWPWTWVPGNDLDACGGPRGYHSGIGAVPRVEH